MPASPKPPLLEYRNVTVLRDEKTLLDSISVTIRDGENVAILGPNGSGKSSFIKTITREYYPAIREEDYVFRIWGRETWNVSELRSILGIVSNDLQYTFIRDIPGRDVILSGFFSSIGLFHHNIHPDMRERAEQVARFLGISHLMDRPMSALSTGEARRFLIGRALVHDPRTLILDEPTNSLDISALHTFRTYLRAIAQSGTGIVMVTHHIHDIIPEISRVILIRDGRFCRDGPKEEILTGDLIGGLFSVPVHIRQEEGYYYATGY